MEKKLLHTASIRDWNLRDELYHYLKEKLKVQKGEYIANAYNSQCNISNNIWHIDDITLAVESNGSSLISVTAYGNPGKIDSLENLLSLKEFAKKRLLEGLEDKQNEKEH